MTEVKCPAPKPIAAHRKHRVCVLMSRQLQAAICSSPFPRCSGEFDGELRPVSVRRQSALPDELETAAEPSRDANHKPWSPI